MISFGIIRFAESNHLSLSSDTEIWANFATDSALIEDTDLK